MKRIRKKSTPIEVSISDTVSDSKLDGDMLSFSEQLEQIISSKPIRESRRVSGSAESRKISGSSESKRISGSTESGKSKKTLSIKSNKITDIHKTPSSHIESKQKTSSIKSTKKSSGISKTNTTVEPQLDKSNINDSLNDYLLIDKRNYNKLDLYDQIRYVNKYGKLVSGGFIIKKDYDSNKKQSVWYLSADRRQTGFNWRVYPDNISQLWKKKIYIPELDRLEYVIEFLQYKYGDSFTNGLPY